VPVFATTVTRDAAFGGSNKVLAEGQTCYLEDANVVQYYDGAAWATVGPSSAGALTLIKAQTIGSAVGSVPVTNVFSATYDNYFVTLSGGVASTTDGMRLTLGATVSGYYWALAATSFANVAVKDAGANVAFFFGGVGSTTALQANFFIHSPFLADETALYGSILNIATNGYGGSVVGYLNNTTSYTAFTLTLAPGTFTGGIIRVYGLQNS